MRIAVVLLVLLLAGCEADPLAPQERHRWESVQFIGVRIDEDRPRHGYTYCLDVSQAATVRTSWIGQTQTRQTITPRDLTWRTFNPVVLPVPFCDESKWREQFAPTQQRLPFEP